MTDELERINALVKQEYRFVETIMTETARVIVGQTRVIERLLISVLTGGHVLLEGVPGLAKTLSIKTLASAVDVGFKRIQFTPDLLPADLIGTMMFNQAKQTFYPKLGPIFSNFILADEINRAPAKVQSALLEAMEERQVTLGDTTHALEEPFLVLATQNPIDQEGTYRLPEAQMDRFLMKIKIDYPSKDEEKLIIERMTAMCPPETQSCVTPAQLLKAKEVVKRVYVDDKVKEYVLDLVGATRRPNDYRLTDLVPLISNGASPRASLALINTAKARAFIKGRGYVTPEDIKDLGKDVLRHRIIPSFEAEAEELDAEWIIDKVFSEIEVP